jgi:hypothetical protein
VSSPESCWYRIGKRELLCQFKTLGKNIYILRFANVLGVSATLGESFFFKNRDLQTSWVFLKHLGKLLSY